MEKNFRQWVKLGTCNVAYRQWGTKGKPVILLHGIPMNSTLWESVGLELSLRGYLVYAPELLGLGYTDGPIGYDHSLNGQARLIAQFANNVVRDEYILVGHDLGGGVAQIMTAEPSTRVRKCVFTNCVAFDSWPVREIKFLIAYAFKDNCMQVFTSEFVLSFLRKALPAGVVATSVITNELLDDLKQGLSGSDERTEHFVRFLRAMDNECTQRVSPKLCTFEQPALVFWAKNDQFQPVSVGEKLREVLSDVTWKTIEGGHFHPLENTALAEAIFHWDNT